MKALYIECGMGAAGDMLMAALFELLDEKQRAEFLSRMNNLGLPGVKVEYGRRMNCGIEGGSMRVSIDGIEELPEAEHDHDHGHDHHHDHEHTHDHDHHHGHSHASMADIRRIVGRMALTRAVKDNILTAYMAIAEAEAKAHGAPVSQIHFHEVGQLDAIADVTGVCILMDLIGAEKVVATPINVGSGTVRCAHGIMPVPAPATAELLKGMPVYSGGQEGELCTPTGAALLKTFVQDFGSMPAMVISAEGRGMGHKEFPDRVNCVRTFLGQTAEGDDLLEGAYLDEVCRLECNIDDMTPEALSFAKDRIYEDGALEVYTVAAHMKKNRDAVVLTCLARPEDELKIAGSMLRNTTTIGIRRDRISRICLERSIRQVRLEGMNIRVKYSTGMGVNKYKIEYDDAAAAAKTLDKPLSEIYARVEAAILKSEVN